MTEGDVYEAVDQYSRQGKIAYVHLRNVTGKVRLSMTATSTSRACCGS
jgi:hypothetical protein